MNEVQTLSLEDLKLAVEAAQRYNTWAIAVIGGSIAVLLGASYQHPPPGRLRLIYLLLPVGWLLLGTSILYGDRVSRNFLAAVYGPANSRDSVLQEMGQNVTCQIQLFTWAMVPFGTWLLIFLVLWIFGHLEKEVRS